MRIATFLLSLPLLAAASAPVQPAGVPIDGHHQHARSAQAAAVKEAARRERDRLKLTSVEPELSR